jgi:hypothetical protein
VASTAFGMVDTKEGCIFDLKTKFSLHVFDTHIIWSISDNIICNILFICILAVSANPNRLWSVKHALIPIYEYMLVS